MADPLKCNIHIKLIPTSWGQVVREPIITNPGLKVDRGLNFETIVCDQSSGSSRTTRLCSNVSFLIFCKM